MRFQSNCISFSSTNDRFSDSFRNSHKGGNGDSEAHSDADFIRINYSDANASTFVYTHAINRAVQLQRPRSRLQGLCNTSAGPSVL
jgi:hypothetical protein